VLVIEPMGHFSGSNRAHRQVMRESKDRCDDFSHVHCRQNDVEHMQTILSCIQEKAMIVFHLIKLLKAILNPAWAFDVSDELPMPQTINERKVVLSHELKLRGHFCWSQRCLL
jgi:hypothetical protein